MQPADCAGIVARTVNRRRRGLAAWPMIAGVGGLVVGEHNQPSVLAGEPGVDGEEAGLSPGQPAHLRIERERRPPATGRRPAASPGPGSCPAKPQHLGYRQAPI